MRRLLLIGLVLVLGGCHTGTSLTDDATATTNLGQSTTRMTDGQLAATGHDTPSGVWSSADQHAVISAVPTTAMTVALPTGLSLHLTTPKDGDITSLGVTFNDDGAISGITIEGIHYSASDVILARAEQLKPLVDYAISLSADERERFLGFVGMVSDVTESAIRAAIPTP